MRHNAWYLKADVEQFFDSIDHDTLLAVLAKKVKDRRLLALVGRIVRNGGADGRGLPIGNLTSQFFANVYLDRFDHFVKDRLGIRWYVRYMEETSWCWTTTSSGCSISGSPSLNFWRRSFI